jgi:aspartate/methionine/tyrosine aminotransferase
MPESTFYDFPNIKSLGMSSWDLAKFLVKELKVALVPGSIFGQNGEGYLRLSFAASSEQLTEGLSRIKAGVENIYKQ